VHIGSRRRFGAGRAWPFASLTADPVVLARLDGRPEAGPRAARRADRSLDEMCLPEGLGAKLLAALSPAAARRGWCCAGAKGAAGARCSPRSRAWPQIRRAPSVEYHGPVRRMPDLAT
jgi:hypothetical protein